MKRYISLVTTLAAFFAGVAAGFAASFFLPSLQSLLIGAVVAVLGFFAIPSHYYAKDSIFNAEAKKLGVLDVNEPVLIVTSKKTYSARICATKDRITFLFRYKGHVVPLVMRRAEGISVSVSEDGYVSVTSKSPEKGVFFTSAPLLSNVAEVARKLKDLGF